MEQDRQEIWIDDRDREELSAAWKNLQDAEAIINWIKGRIVARYQIPPGSQISPEGQVIPPESGDD